MSQNYDLKEFGKRLQALRNNHGLTQHQLGNVLGVSKVTICNWEAGKGGGPNTSQLETLIKETRCDLNHLITGEESCFIDTSDLWPGNQLLLELAANILRIVETTRDKHWNKWWEDNKGKAKPPEPPWYGETEIPPELLALFKAYKS